MYSLLKKIILFLVFGLSFTGISQMIMPEDIVDWRFTVEQNDCEATVVGTFTVKEHWHINATSLPEDNFGIPTTFKLHTSNKFQLVGDVIEPKPIEKYDEKSKENLRYHEGTFKFKQKIKILSDADFEIKLDFGYQPCDSVQCLFPFEEVFSVKVKGCGDNNSASSDESEAATPLIESVGSASMDDDLANIEEDEETFSADNAEENSIKSDIKKHSLWWIFWVSFGSGLIALVTPCVFPMIPMTVSYFIKTSKTKSAGIRNAILYGISIIVIYILLGILVTWLFGAESLNGMATNPTFNIIFFFILVIFAISFMGAFEITLPSSWANKADSKADSGGLIGIFFMALALALVSFSCTGPIVGVLLVQAATEGGVAPFIGMFGFSLALALPFALFAAFPGWLNTMPKSGGWLNSVKVVLGILELALAFKFLSNADLALQTHFLERELFIAIWIGIFLLLALYLFGKIRLPNDSPVEKLSVGRTLFGTFVLIFVIYLIPGMWGAPLKLISAFPPPMSYSESPLGVGKDIDHSVAGSLSSSDTKNYIDGTHLGPQNIYVFDDYDNALAHAQKVNKPLMIDFTGHNCVNCRKMEQSVWGESGIIEILRDSVVIASLHVDERVKLPKEEQKEVAFPNGRKKMLRTVGDKWTFKQVSEYMVTAQPYYIFQDLEGNDLKNGPADYQHHSNPRDFKTWLEQGLQAFREKQSINQ